jgi:hypothetical protein
VIFVTTARAKTSIEEPSLKSPIPELSYKRIFTTWWPLAASWLLMAIESPALVTVVARLDNPEINLAAYGGVVFPLALIIESPIIMLLAASTALSRDWDSYRKLHRFMMTASGILTVLHLFIAFTPLYYFIVEGLIGAPEEIVEPARIGLMIMTPWTWSIAYRRFHQGVLIRFGHSRAVSVGTLIRLTSDGIVLVAGYLLANIPGIVVATCAVAAGVISEATYVGLVVRPVLRNELRFAQPVKESLTLRSFLDFYFPLAMTSLLTMLIQPIGSAALSRMPKALESLAVWPVISGLVFLFRSLGMSYNEVVVAMIDEPNSSGRLRKFTAWLAIISSVLLMLVATTSLSNLWFEKVTALSPGLVAMAQSAIWIAIPIPAFTVLQSWFQGVILNSRKTRAITEAVVFFLVINALTLTAGVLWGRMTGLHIALASLVISLSAQTMWLLYRSQPARMFVSQRDEVLKESQSRIEPTIN